MYRRALAVPVSLAIATGVAMTLNYGVDHLAKGAVNPVGCGDSDEDETAP